jgi:hypothetical protein
MKSSIRDNFFFFLKSGLVLSVMGYVLYGVFSRLTNLTLFNIILLIVVSGGCIGAIFGLFKEYKDKSVKDIYFKKGIISLLNILCGVSLILFFISIKTNLIKMTMQSHVLLFTFAALLFATSTAIKFFERKKRSKSKTK